MKKSFDINITSYQSKTVVSIIKANSIFLLTGEQIESIFFETFDNRIVVYISDCTLVCENAWEWKKAKNLILAVMPDQKSLEWHKKKHKAHPCYQDYSK